MRRRRKPKEKANHERWLITYSDLITLLMIFFVVMYAMSKIDQVKFMTLQQSLSQALHQSSQVNLQNMGSTSLISAANPSDQGSKTSGVASSQLSKQQSSDPTLDNLYSQVKTYIQQHHLQANVSILNEQRAVQITLRDVVLFDTGQASLRPGAQQLLRGLVPFLQSLNNPIVIEGYTDNQPIDTPQFPSNWELSSARAIGVVRFFVGQGIAPQRLSGVGYGQYHPVAPNNSPANRQLNRRVNIVILRTNVAQEIQPPVSGSKSLAVVAPGS